MGQRVRLDCHHGIAGPNPFQLTSLGSSVSCQERIDSLYLSSVYPELQLSLQRRKGRVGKAMEDQREVIPHLLHDLIEAFFRQCRHGMELIQLLPQDEGSARIRVQAL